MHKVDVCIVVVGMYSMFVQKGRDREKKRGGMSSLCIAFVYWDEFEQAGDFQDAHGGVEGGGSWALVWRLLVVLDVSGPEPECHIPLSG